ncbi:homoserine O-acetyltransferase [Belliella kenyensis]|uniref:Homoserine O-acetyltransferase n=1 Tax=Belliella kenyensis TaxID=1472724 RepID=A0ABV8EH27_9BACT|nr:homoserine O-acetyltransferase [Belliella kenyensis]MCH7401731.1 homoserine O-acetyltransferase [Belliella kenyensis]MDN3604231.1 homoserine O-acetyltransferase [Belliella kenyensis]
MNLASPHLIVDMAQETFTYEGEFQLESGETLSGFQLTYTAQGHLTSSKDNVIWVIHALTGDANVNQWWPGLIGEDQFFDPTRHYIICANLLGSCYGSTSPLSTNPKTGKAYYYDFPSLTTRDMANALDLLRAHLGINQINTLIGGSLGGQVGLEWAYLLQEKVKYTIILASNAKASPWIIGFNESQRMAISADQTWGRREKDAGKKGLEAARAIAMLTYRHPENFAERQSDSEGTLDHFRASTYLNYQGKKLADRFNAYSYWVLTKAMDSHDLGRGRENVAHALARIPSKVLAIGVDKDLLFLKEESQYVANKVSRGTYREIQSTYGHDAFLIEYGQLNYILTSFYLENNE